MIFTKMSMYFIPEMTLHGFFVHVASFPDVLACGNGFYAKNSIDIGLGFDFRVHRMTLTHCSKVWQYMDKIQGFHSIVKNEFLHIYGLEVTKTTKFSKIQCRFFLLEYRGTRLCKFEILGT